MINPISINQNPPSSSPIAIPGTEQDLNEKIASVYERLNEQIAKVQIKDVYERLKNQIASKLESPTPNLQISSKEGDEIIDSKVSIHTLPNSSIFEIFSFLELKEFGNISLVHKKWNDFSNHEDLWIHLFPEMATFNNTPKSSFVLSFHPIIKRMQNFSSKLELNQEGSFICNFPRNPRYAIQITLTYGQVTDESPPKLLEVYNFIKAFPNDTPLEPIIIKNERLKSRMLIEPSDEIYSEILETTFQSNYSVRIPGSLPRKISSVFTFNLSGDLKRNLDHKLRNQVKRKLLSEKDTTTALLAVILLSMGGYLIVTQDSYKEPPAALRMEERFICTSITALLTCFLVSLKFQQLKWRFCDS